ncbi:ribbon-helix-helix protein, CopG family [Candidatus Electrothrix sp.]|uniref:ribbon-helix-helix protein, CopG family n=1 Tax=Candidatus Electrothrix sp. TaxID=2170559 RepID=UPI00405693A5
MDKVFSARVDEAVIRQIDLLTRELKTSKKAIIESAIRLYSEQSGLRKKVDVFEQTCGSWNRSESPEETVNQARSAFRKSMERHQL